MKTTVQKPGSGRMTPTKNSSNRRAGCHGFTGGSAGAAGRRRSWVTSKPRLSGRSVAHGGANQQEPADENADADNPEEDDVAIGTSPSCKRGVHEEHRADAGEQQNEADENQQDPESRMPRPDRRFGCLRLPAVTQASPRRVHGVARRRRQARRIIMMQQHTASRQCEDGTENPQNESSPFPRLIIPGRWLPRRCRGRPVA